MINRDRRRKVFQFLEQTFHLSLKKKNIHHIKENVLI